MTIYSEHKMFEEESQKPHWGGITAKVGLGSRSARSRSGLLETVHLSQMCYKIPHLVSCTSFLIELAVIATVNITFLSITDMAHSIICIIRLLAVKHIGNITRNIY